MEVEKINPYADDPRGKTQQVREMFDAIAPAYDFMNRAMTLGIDRLWRRRAVGLLAPGDRAARILDIATGTGDLALELARRLKPAAVVGVDLSEGMIEVGRRKVEAAKLPTEITLEQADCLALPFGDGEFSAITCAYGVRNFSDLAAGYAEMFRVMRPGGRIVILELSTPRGAVTYPLYKLYTRYVIPTLGRLVSRDVRAYSYLPESIAAVPQGDQMLAIMAGAGFTETRAIPLTFGACTIYTAIRPN